MTLTGLRSDTLWLWQLSSPEVPIILQGAAFSLHFKIIQIKNNDIV